MRARRSKPRTVGRGTGKAADSLRCERLRYPAALPLLEVRGYFFGVALPGNRLAVWPGILKIKPEDKTTTVCKIMASERTRTAGVAVPADSSLERTRAHYQLWYGLRR